MMREKIAAMLSGTVSKVRSVVIENVVEVRQWATLAREVVDAGGPADFALAAAEALEEAVEKRTESWKERADTAGAIEAAAWASELVDPLKVTLGLKGRATTPAAIVAAVEAVIRDARTCEAAERAAKEKATERADALAGDPETMTELRRAAELNDRAAKELERARRAVDEHFARVLELEAKLDEAAAREQAAKAEAAKAEIESLKAQRVAAEASAKNDAKGDVETARRTNRKLKEELAAAKEELEKAKALRKHDVADFRDLTNAAAMARNVLCALEDGTGCDDEAIETAREALSLALKLDAEEESPPVAPTPRKKREIERVEKAHAVACPKCHAVAGKRCVSEVGELMRAPHGERFAVAFPKADAPATATRSFVDVDGGRPVYCGACVVSAETAGSCAYPCAKIGHAWRAELKRQGDDAANVSTCPACAKKWTAPHNLSASGVVLEPKPAKVSK